jgi:hypothetical protein
MQAVPTHVGAVEHAPTPLFLPLLAGLAGQGLALRSAYIWAEYAKEKLSVLIKNLA